MNIRQPMLSAKVTLEEARQLPFPMLGFFKYDGIRAVGDPKLGLVSRKMKPIPNVEVRKMFDKCHYLDGELIFGSPNDPQCYNMTESVVTTRGASAKGVCFYVFDSFKDGGLPYLERRKQMELSALFMKAMIQYAPWVWLRNFEALERFEKRAVKLGYEGIMLRRPDGLYKDGRSTVREAYLVKLKRFIDFEVKILSVYPRMKNNNKLEEDERGYAKRSTHKANKVAQAEAGGFHVALHGKVPKELREFSVVEFDMGPGSLTQDARRICWEMRASLPGKIAVCRAQPAGMKELPRFPRFAGWRSKVDL